MTSSRPGCPGSVVADVVARALAEDLGAAGDVTTLATVDAGLIASAELVTRQDGVVAGLPVGGLRLRDGRPGAGARRVRLVPTAPG